MSITSYQKNILNALNQDMHVVRGYIHKRNRHVWASSLFDFVALPGHKLQICLAVVLDCGCIGLILIASWI